MLEGFIRHRIILEADKIVTIMGSCALMLWTGGKDSALAMWKADMDMKALVTFAPPKAEFQAHPIPVMKLQAEALGLPHRTATVREPYKESYVEAIRALTKEYGADTLITGDIDLVDGYPNWIRECAEPIGVKVLTPLWGIDRENLLQELIAAGFDAVISYVKTPPMTADWIGRHLDKAAIADLKKLKAEQGIDITGENGEYHTIVLDGPTFKKKIKLPPHKTKKTKNTTHIEIEKQKKFD
jgi:diphthine-ammonia ligase